MKLNIFNSTIKEISYPEREKTIEARTDSKGIRLDVYVEKIFLSTKGTIDKFLPTFRLFSITLTKAFFQAISLKNRIKLSNSSNLGTVDKI